MRQAMILRAFGVRVAKTSTKTSTPQLPFNRSQIPSYRDHKALNRGTLGGVGIHGLSVESRMEAPPAGPGPGRPPMPGAVPSAPSSERGLPPATRVEKADLGSGDGCCIGAPPKRPTVPHTWTLIHLSLIFCKTYQTLHRFQTIWCRAVCKPSNRPI